MFTFFPVFGYKIFSWLGVVFLSTTLIRFMLVLDSNKRVYNHTPGPCRILRGIENGSAGIEYVPQLNAAFISSGLHNTNGEGYGAIFLYDFTTAEEGQAQPVRTHEAKALRIEASDSFHPGEFAPLGLSHFHSKGRFSLYVVNTHPKRRCVEVFTYVREKLLLQHRKSICDGKLTSGVDVAVIGADRFFVTNLAYFSKGHLQSAELAIQMDTGSILLYDGKEITYAMRFFGSPTGIHFDAERSRVVVSSVMNEVIGVFSMARDFSLSHSIDISLLSSPAGVYVEPKTGDILAALHPIMHSAYFLWTLSSSSFMSPSQVLRIRLQEDGKSWVVTEPYANDGATISGSNAIVYVNDQILIGTLFGRALLCDVDYPTLT